MTKKEACFLKTKRLCDIRTECAAETSLPDYNTDVRKILHVSAKPHPISSFASDEGIECSGEVTFEVVYLDFEGAVCSASFSGDYSFKAKCDTGAYKDSLVETVLGNLSLRLLSPRKISAKASLESSVTLVFEETVSIDGDALDADKNAEVDEQSISAVSTVMTPAAEREYGVSLARFDGKTTDEVHLVHISVTPVVERIEVFGDEAELAGKIEVSALIRTDEYPLYRLDKSLELSQKIPLGDVDAAAELKSVIEVVSASVATEGDEGGVEMMLNVITEARVVGEKNESINLATDAYLCQCHCECTHENLSYDEYMGRRAMTKEISDKVPLSNLGVGKLREVVWADAQNKVCSVECADGSVAVESEIRVSIIAAEINDEGGVEFVPIKFVTKLNENVNLGCHMGDKTSCFADIKLSGVSATVDSDYIYFKADARLEVGAVSHREARVLTRARAVLSEPYHNNPSRISVYYPSDGDTLYTVAKAYHTTKEKILADNPSALDTVANGEVSALKHLIIT